MNMLSTPVAGATAELGRNLTYGLFELLGRSIVRGEYAREAFPTEGVLAERFGVSRSVSREAVKLLSAKGLLDGRPKNGTFVRSDDHWNLFDVDVLRWHVDRGVPIRLLREFTEVRRAVESEAAEHIATHGTIAKIRAIGDIVTRMRGARSNNDDPVAVEIAFHLTVLDASSNPFFKQFRGLLAAVLPASVRLIHQLSEKPRSVDGYAAVHDAIVARDTDVAHGAMRRILTDTIARLDALAPAD